MIYVGIDIAKLNHFASAISSDGEILIEPFKFTNDANGFQLLTSQQDTLALQDDSLIIGLESTAHYGDNLVQYLVASYFKVCAQPYQDVFYAKKQHSKDEDGQGRHIHHC